MDDRLQKFVHLVDAGSFTQASKELHISQPALSSAIHKLEHELHATLLIRDTRSIHLTPAGKIAYEAGKELAILARNLTTRLSVLTKEKLAISLGMIDSVAQIWSLSANSLDYLDQQARVALIVNNSRILQQSVLRDELDMAFIAEQPHQETGTIEARYVASEPLIVVYHPMREYTVKQELKDNRLSEFLNYDQQSHSFRLINQSLARQGITAESWFYSTSPEVMVRLVLLNKGVAALPYHVVRPYIADHRLMLARLSGRPLIIERRIVVISRRDRVLSSPHRHVIAQTRTLTTKLYQESQEL